jgi:hypothetical protein
VQAKGIGNIFNTNNSNSPNLKKEKLLQVQEALRTPKSHDLNGTTPQHIGVKIISTEKKQRLLKSVRKKSICRKSQITFKGKPIKTSAHFSTETLKARQAWSEVFQALKENNFSSRILYPEKLSFKIARGIKIIHDKQKLKQCMTIKQPL